jgi:putative hydrolase of the HAD superfamily
VVVFDAVGTLIHPDPSPGDVYAAIGARFGSRLDPDEVRVRFAAAFKAQEQHDRLHGLHTDEAREQERWRHIVAEVLDVADPAGCFAALYEHFARPESWRCEQGAAGVLGALDRAGFLLGMASNFDHRLHGVVRGLAELRPIRRLVISSEVGWKKPARPFFDRLCEGVAAAPGEVLLVGDDLENDFLGAKTAGLQALLFDPRRRAVVPPPAERIADLAELLGGPPE